MPALLLSPMNRNGPTLLDDRVLYAEQQRAFGADPEAARWARGDAGLSVRGALEFSIIGGPRPGAVWL